MNKLFFPIIVFLLISSCATKDKKITTSNNDFTLISTSKGYYYKFGNCDPTKYPGWYSSYCFGGECLKKQFEIDVMSCKKLLSPEMQLGEH